MQSAATPVDALPAFLDLVRALVAAAPYAPTFEREVVQPAMGKLAVAMSRLIERLVADGEWNALLPTMETVRALVSASPAPFRPAVNTIRPALTGLVLRTSSGAPAAIRGPAADTLALLHMCSGKAAAPATWGSDMKDALGGVAASISALAADAWEEEPPRTSPLPPSASTPAFPLDPLLRVPAALDAIEGYTEIALSLLSVTSQRPVPIPLAQVVSTSLRLLNLTLDTPTAAHISPQHHAAMVASLPRLWASGLLLLATAATAAGDHLVPHLASILEHTVYLLERVPASMSESRLKLVHFHSILLEVFPPAILPLEYTTRLLRFSLGIMGSLLDTRPQSSSTITPQHRSKGKKRARGAEDALVAGLEGRASRPPSQEVVDIVLAALELTRQLHTAPMLPAALLTFSIRLHLSLHLALASRPALMSHGLLTSAVDDVLQEAAHLEAGGTARDVRALLVSVLPSTSKRNMAFDALLHPALPPMARPLPPLAQLHMFAPESDEEKKVRRELGFGGEERDQDDDEEDDDEAMAVDEPVSFVQPAVVPVVTPVVPAVVMPVLAPVAPVQSAPAPFSVPVVVPAPAPIAAPIAAPVAAAEPAVPSVPFMSAPSSKPSSASVAEAAPVAAAPAPGADGDSDDEAIPDLDSGSEDEDEDDE